VVGADHIDVPPLLSMNLDYEPFRDGWVEVGMDEIYLLCGLTHFTYSTNTYNTDAHTLPHSTPLTPLIAVWPVEIGLHFLECSRCREIMG